MLRKMRLQNVKGFVDTGEIEFRPITLLIGQNSSGKSSLVRFPLVLRQTLQDDSMAPLLFYGRSIDYGSFHDVVFGHEEERKIKFTLTFDPSYITHAPYARRLSKLKELSQGLFTMSVEMGKVENNLVIHNYVLNLGGRDVLTASRMDTGGYRVELSMGAVKGKSELPAEAVFDKFIPDFRTWYMLERSLRSKKTSVPDLERIELFYELLSMVNNYWTDFASSVSYIGPFRRTPERAYRHKDNAVWQVGSDGEYAPVVLAQDFRAGGTLVDDVSEWLHRNLRFRLWVDDLKGDMFRILIEDEDTGAKNNLIDVGHGLSQLIPIVIQAFMSSRSTARRRHPRGYDLIVIEQPELHLHPAAQASLADLFVEGVRLHRKDDDQLRKFFLIETHSEHMLLRLRRYIAEDKLDPDLLAVYYTSKIPGTKSVNTQRLIVNRDGSIPNWPEGFFSQDYEEVMAMHEALRKKHQQGEDAW